MEDNEFIVKNKDGEDVNCTILYRFSNNSTNYILYTDYELDENGEFNVLASRYSIIDNKINLIPITDDEEWEFVNEKWSKYNEE